MDLLLDVSYEFFSLLSCFTTASPLACVAVVSVRFLLGQALQARKTREAIKQQKRRGKRKCFLSFPAPPHPVPFFLSRLFVLAPRGLKETETTSTQPTSSLKRPFNP